METGIWTNMSATIPQKHQLSCDGFYWPVGVGFMEHVKCQWNDAELQYRLTCTQLQESEVSDKFEEAARLACQNIIDSVGQVYYSNDWNIYQKSIW